VSEWTVDTLHAHVVALFGEKDRAVQKLETATEKRFEGVNEFRAQLADQQRTLMPRQEAELRLGALDHDQEALEQRLAALENKSRGFSGGWGWAVGVIGLIAIVVSLFLALRR
jgi:acyl transferase domain-containing protein